MLLRPYWMPGRCCARFFSKLSKKIIPVCTNKEVESQKIKEICKVILLTYTELNLCSGFLF
jgi:hypothetical protein